MTAAATVHKSAQSDIHPDLTTLIGGTPLVELANIVRNRGLAARILAKVEFFNPAGSVKDRAALGIITAAERAGQPLSLPADPGLQSRTWHGRTPGQPAKGPSRGMSRPKRSRRVVSA